MPSGTEMVELAKTRVGQRYDFVVVPKNNPKWPGPWDCAEFLSWLVYQVSGTKYLYGCIDNNSDPALADAFTGAWKTDSLVRGARIPVPAAVRTIGGILLRFPKSGRMGHVALSDGYGSLLEAHSRKAGVTGDRSPEQRRWDIGILIPGFTYTETDYEFAGVSPQIYRLGASAMGSETVKAIQAALQEAGVDPGPIDGIYGPNTASAVGAFQAQKGLLVDGEVGPETAAILKIKLSTNQRPTDN
ncbi:hypothetical protein B5C34_14600 [Pacificimonas flava]|uniref:Peptidoglycan binding-like domain-containing protein n=2 Tax=Pacificimonas TaxID=1960290 RepID=A0A219B087_9SPHN|nr:MULTISPECIES: peptidoglycan-binding domain-containing protein [Pacificimonas]MBZ6379806.1 peptidoglycan-binding protein [Pacificimonas aurantium]OWV31741.1 hypothetical protein B5C34_14600 [Pacificimonas flava]